MAHGLQQEGLERHAAAAGTSGLPRVSLDVQLSEEAFFKGAAPAPGEPAPRLRVRRVTGTPDTIELTVQDLQVMADPVPEEWERSNCTCLS